MFADSLARRSRLLGATALVIATGAAVLAPTAAFADTAAPGAAKPAVSTTLGSAAKPAPLALDGAAVGSPVQSGTQVVQSFSDSEGTVSFQKPFETTLTLANTGAAIDSEIRPNLDLKWGADNAPADFTLDLWQDGAWAPVTSTGNYWHLPALSNGLGEGASHSYKLRVSLKNYTAKAPTFTGWLTAMSTTEQGPVAETQVAHVTVDGTRVQSGTQVVQSFSDSEGTVSFQKPFETTLTLANTGAAIDSEIRPNLDLKWGADNAPADFTLDLWQDGAWAPVTSTGNYWHLPALSNGLGEGASHSYKLRVSLKNYTAKAPTFTGSLTAMSTTEQGPVAETQVAHVTVDGTPVQTGSGSSTDQPGQPSGSTAVNAGLTDTAKAPASQVVRAADTSSTPSTDLTPASASLASTGGGSNSGALIGAGGALVVLGAGAVFFAQRHRRQTQN
ncbi:hypothetical protein [Kitasatospora sp. HPMI-4]|uniref:hypothetical protein n=1 Tax=Kitasatospora sp. HPMI-4 TaxID=3448443 RepID=UPI003F1D87FE